MKKSEIYQTAQKAILASSFSAEVKLEVLRELMYKESTALFCEKKEEKEQGENW